MPILQGVSALSGFSIFKQLGHRPSEITPWFLDHFLKSEHVAKGKMSLITWCLALEVPSRSRNRHRPFEDQLPTDRSASVLPYDWRNGACGHSLCVPVEFPWRAAIRHRILQLWCLCPLRLRGAPQHTQSSHPTPSISLGPLPLVVEIHPATVHSPGCQPAA